MNKINKLLKEIGFDPVKVYLNAETSKKDIMTDNKGQTGIYKWTNKETSDSYVGSGIDLGKRIRSYYQDSELKKNPRHINKALLKYGHGKFDLEILEYCEKEKLLEREQFYLDKLSPAYNILKKAYSLDGFKHKAETIELLKERKFSQQHKENLSKANTGRVFSEETLNKLSESLTRYHENNSLTPEALENIKQKTTDRECVPVTLTNVETGEEVAFPSQTEAGKFLGITRQAIKKGLERNSVLSKLFRVKPTVQERTQNKDFFTKSNVFKNNEEKNDGNIPPSSSDDVD